MAKRWVDRTRAMKLKEFERRSRRAYEEIPDEYKAGVDGLTISDEALPHPTLPDVYTLGMCLTEPYPSDWTGPETLRSTVVLYHGSFQRLAELDPDFDWGEQIWETLTHELRHHLESLAGDDQLEDIDYALDETFKRYEGEPFDPWYFQRGDVVAPGVYQVEQDFYLEQVRSPEHYRHVDTIHFQWHGDDFVIPAPTELGDVHFIRIWGLDVGSGALELVLERKRTAWETFKGIFTGWSPTVLESEAWARPMWEAPADMDDPVREPSRPDGEEA